MMKFFGTVCCLLIAMGMCAITVFVLSESWDDCQGDADCIQRNQYGRNSLTIGAKRFFLSSIYKDKRNAKYKGNHRRNELFVKDIETHAIQQLTFDKSHISALAYSPALKSIVFAQAQWNDPAFAYIPVINSPGKFGNFKLFSLDLSGDGMEISPLQHEGFSEIKTLGFDKTGKKLIFQTIYGSNSIKAINLETNRIEEIVPESELFWWDPKAPMFFSIQKIDSGRNVIYFKALDGYLSKENRGFVYNEYSMNLDTKVVTRRTDRPFYRGPGKTHLAK